MARAAAIPVEGTGSAVTVGGTVGAVTVEGTVGAVTMVCAATWQFKALVTMVAGVSTVVTGVTVVAAAPSPVSASVVSPILYGITVFLLNAEHRMR